MKDFYYYLKDSDGRKKVTVCLLADEGRIVSRGLAICSDSDNFCRAEGRKRSLGRAKAAYETGRLSRSVKREEAINIISSTGFIFGFKSMLFGVPRNPIEEKIEQVVASKYFGELDVLPGKEGNATQAIWGTCHCRHQARHIPQA